MKCQFYSLILISAFLWGISIPGFAQSSDVSKDTLLKSDNSFFDQLEWIRSDQPNIHEINFMGGYSFHSNRGFWGKIPKATLSIYILRYNRKIVSLKNRHILEYVAEVNVAANYSVRSSKRFKEGSFNGYGLTPLGFQFNWRKNNTVQPFLKSSTGFMYLDKRFPDARGTKFNFTLEFGTGVEFVVGENLSFTIGYKYHHMSNFFLGKINPGVDSNIFYSGITIF